MRVLVRRLRLCLALAALALAVLACGLPSDLPVAFFPQPPATLSADSLTATASSAGAQPIDVQVGYGVHAPWYDLYFTDPFNSLAKMEEGGPDQYLVQAIDQARISVDMAAYSFDLISVRDALLRAHDRGVEVRLVMESTNMNDTVPQRLVQAGIPIIGDYRDGLMHDKFVVIDRAEVWTGSMNFTTAAAYHDNNNLVRIRNTQVADDYETEFKEMFEENFFGPDAIAATPYPVVDINGTNVEVYFSPDDHVARRIVQLLRSAQKSIDFMAFSFTASDFGDILVQKAKQGLAVSGVMESTQVKSNQGTEYIVFRDAKLPVYLDGNPGEMHHKVFIIDDKIVITGSYNFSASAENTNDENVVIFFSPQIAAYYEAEFQRVTLEAIKALP